MDAHGDCPCGRLGAKGRRLTFAQCCGPFLADHDGRPAPDAECLMRSRYCAFVLQDDDYLLATWHDSTRPSHVSFEPGTKWIGLEVREHAVLDDTHAEVEFIARFRSGGRAERLHERSRFVKEDGRWFYVDGQHR
jgi:SEC-C motif-containing protein